MKRTFFAFFDESSKHLEDKKEKKEKKRDAAEAGPESKRARTEDEEGGQA